MSVRSAFVVLSAAIAATAVLACEEDSSSAPGASSGGPALDGGGGEAGSGPPASPAPSGTGAEFCQKTLGVVAGALETCCTADDKTTTDYQFMHGIVSSLLPVCQEALEASIAKGRVLFRAERGAACYAAYETTYAPGKCSNVTQTYADPAGSACRETFVGTVAEGAPCMGDHECADGLTCVGYTKVSEGTCKVPPAIGEPCGPGRSDAGATGAASLELGAHPSCADGARCDPLERKCVKAAANGEACGSTDDCAASLHCVLGKCITSGPGGPGATCAVADDCTPDSYCERASGASEGTCAKKKAAGGTCTGAMFVSECIGRCDAEPGEPGSCASFCGSP